MGLPDGTSIYEHKLLTPSVKILTEIRKAHRMPTHELACSCDDCREAKEDDDFARKYAHARQTKRTSLSELTEYTNRAKEDITRQEEEKASLPLLLAKMEALQKMVDEVNRLLRKVIKVEPQTMIEPAEPVAAPVINHPVRQEE